MQKITPFLWFDGKAEEAMKFYVSIFKNSKILSANRFQLDGQEFLVLNGGPQFTFSPAVSFFVNCETQQEVDELWEKLSEGGQKHQCGWVQDKFGVSWQIVPRMLPELLGGDAERTDRVMRGVMGMKKLDIAQMERAASSNYARRSIGRHIRGPQ